MRLLRATLLAYRSIDYMEFEAGPFTVLFGKNNSGKTNILEAVYDTINGTGFKPASSYYYPPRRRRSHAANPPSSK